MKVLYITNIPSPFRVDFFNEFGKYCDLTVIFERKRAKDRERDWQSLEFHYFKGIFLKGKSIGADLSFCPEIVKYLQRKYDKIIFGGYTSPTCIMAIEYLRMKKIPFWLNADGGVIKKDKLLVGMLKHHIISSARGWLSTGNLTTQYLCHYGAKKELVYLYPFTSMLEQELYNPSLEEKENKKHVLHINEKKVIISVGQFIPRKGFDLLVETAKRLKYPAGIYIIGGKANEKYASIENVHFIDFMDKARLREYYIAADLFVFPTREDVWGLVLNEAMAYGLPVVASTNAIASHELVIEGENGFLVNPEDIEKMAEKIDKILSDDDMRQNMGKISYEIIQGYTIEKMALRHMEILQK